MAFKISDATNEDLAEWATGDWDAFMTDPEPYSYLILPYRDHLPIEERRRLGIEGMKDGLSKFVFSVSNAVKLKATMPDGKIVGGAYFPYFDENPFKEPKRHDAVWHEETGAREWCSRILRLHRGQRETKMNRPHVYFNILWTLTEHRRLGIGSELLKRAIDLADEKSLPMWLESNPRNIPFYQRAGFVVVKQTTYNEGLLGLTDEEKKEFEKDPSWCKLRDLTTGVQTVYMFRAVKGEFKGFPWEE